MGFGDIIVPKTQTIDYPVLLDMDKPTIQAYSLESVFAEKFQAMVTLSIVNSRMKDFYDIFTLLDRHDFDGRVLQESINETFTRRGTIVERNHVIFTDGFAKDLSRTTQWNAFLKRTGLEAMNFEAVMNEITRFLKPIYDANLAEREFFRRWDSNEHRWNSYSP